MGARILSKKQVNGLLSDNGKLKNRPPKKQDSAIITVPVFSMEEMLNQIWTGDILPLLTEAANTYVLQENSKCCTDFFRWCSRRHIYYKEDTGWLKADDPHYGPFTDDQQFEFYQRDIKPVTIHDHV